MNIELKNLKVADNLSQESTAFTADLYINDVYVADCKNNGRGGITTFHPIDAKHKDLLREAEYHCKNLPPVSVSYGSKEIVVSNSLEIIVENLVSKMIAAKERGRFERQMLQDMKRGILVGTNEKYAMYNFKKPLEEIIRNHPNATQFINTQLRQIAPKIKKGERVLNTNFPEGVHIPQTEKTN